MRLHIANGRLIDPANAVDGLHDLYLADGQVVATGVAPDGFHADRVLDARGLAVLPGLVDLSARVAQPGHATGLAFAPAELRAALAGGVTRLVLPPDAEAVPDEPGKVDTLMRQREAGQPRIHPLGAMTVGLAGQTLTEMGLLAQAGCLAFAQGEHGIADTRVLWGAMRYASGLGHTLWLRPHDPWLAPRAVAASGAYAERLGLEGLPPQAETVALNTIFELQRATGARVHLTRLSTAAGLALLRAARREGLAVTADVSVHHLHLTDVDIGFFDTHYHLQPPLRGQRDRDAIQAALADGLIQALCSDHTPVDDLGKAAPFPASTPGATALELLLSLSLKWARDQRVPLADALARVTSGPGALLSSLSGNAAQAGQLGVGAPADACLVDLDAEWLVAPTALQSRSPHTPFAGMMLPGRVRATVVGGELAWETSV
ncbi:dihydroorotase [Achromobacter piechaudii]|uniref:Dihydroorotase-like protein n=1 Tax=Achromobacter piechaudii TaxID=72556 RepID=A0ABM8KQP9_9BURK|nr:dihydroorotase [Achromobacter piechaudii]KNY04937.1 dihydroorotase [Achromobacter piechaudii]CAB3652938.1 Dihydroorotase-like protein [Achromobacter piechaudii]CAB3815470.1 Dihydroorotase-like protein [Achromobacter piechaudii]CAB3946116.1 Dihydroorotase-like protein [Achromobacter piechaudii]